jgi:Flp pilus assembly protein TadG
MVNWLQKCFLRDKGGNASIMFAFNLLPILILVGIGVDYTQSSSKKAALDVVADSASLAAVTPALLASTDQVWIVK